MLGATPEEPRPDAQDGRKRLRGRRISAPLCLRRTSTGTPPRWPSSRPETSATLDELRAEARRAAEEARAASTERAYAADWRDFSAFCARIGRGHLPAEPETIALYLADLMHRGRAASTWERRLAAIGVYHRAICFESPTEHEIVRSVHRGLRRRVGVAQSQKTALIDEGLREVISAIDAESLPGIRDRALLLVGFAGALRRSALELDDLRFEPDGIVVRLRRSKGDQEGAGVEVSIPLGLDEATCPLGALQRWLERAEIVEGRVFRRIDRHGNLGPALSASAIGEIVKRRAEEVGLEGDFSGHSLRSGLATSAALAGKTEASIMRHGRWRSERVARRYIRAGQRWDDNAAAGLL
jgi:site-specific recombinase XerD